MTQPSRRETHLHCTYARRELEGIFLPLFHSVLLASSIQPKRMSRSWTEPLATSLTRSIRSLSSKWAYVDVSFGLYEDGKSVTEVAISLGGASIYIKSGKQKIVTRSSTEAELVGISDALSQILWTREFLLALGLTLGPATVYQDKKSTILLANKGRSISERSRHIKIRYFFVSHYIESKKITLEYLTTGQMEADILMKPLHGSLFAKFSKQLTGN